MTDRDLLKQALDSQEFYELCQQYRHSMMGAQEFEALKRWIIERLAQPEQDWDWRHPKAQALIGAKARLEITLRLIEQLLEDPHFEPTASDMEYWEPLHDKLQERLAQPEFDSALQSAAMTQTTPKLAQPEHDYRTRYDRGCYKCGSHYCPADCSEQECCQDTAQCLNAGVCVAKHGHQPEQSPLDRMAENARELGLDYAPVQEPVAWQWLDTGTFRKSLPASAEPGAWRPLYTIPPRLEPLDIREICASICDRVAVYERQATTFSEDSLPWASFCADLIRGKQVDA